MLKAASQFLLRRGSVAVACRAALIAVVVLAGVAVAVRSLPASVPAGTDVSESDKSGLNLLEPAESVSTAPKAKTQVKGDLERSVGEWTPTGGGPGGSGSPKQ
jgi:hypothetical protein